MRLLIDGYNLLHATDLFGSGALEGTLRGSRDALLEHLARSLPEKLRKHTVIVFDATDAPPGLADWVEHEGMRIRFARGYADADALLEEILSKARGTKHLTVVSGDHRVQRAARSRGARPVDSESWFRTLRISTRPAGEAKPTQAVGGTEHWVSEFSDPDALKAIEQEALSAPPPKPLPTSQDAAADNKPVKKRAKKRRGEPRRADSKGEFGEGVFDPFPPGYADDLLRGDGAGERRNDSDAS